MTQITHHDVMTQLAQQMEEASFPVVLCDTALRVQSQNRYVREKMKALSFPGALDALITPDRMEEICRRLREGESLQLDTVLSGALDAVLSLSPVRQEEQVVGVMVTLVPHSGQVEDPAHLTTDNAALFSASFRKPLTDIFASLAVMNRNLQATGDRSMDEYLRTINRSSYQMLRNTTNIMHRMSSFFSFRPQPVLVDIWERFAELLEASAIVLRPAGILLEYHLPESTALVNCDFSAVASAFMNLLSNACRHGNDQGYITVTGKDRDSSVVLTITDSGPGFPADYAPRAFTSYSSRGRQGTAYAGLGLGLTVARQVIQEAGGTLAVGETSDQGTTVVFSLPVVQEGEPASRMPMDCGSAAYLRDRFSPVYVGLCDVVPPPEQ